MATRGAIQALNDIRLAGLKEASEKRDVNQLMSWHSEDAIFTDAGKTKVPFIYLFAGFSTYAMDSKELLR